MFESAELGHCISKSEYGAAVPKLREALLKTQYELLADKTFPVVIIIGGVDGARHQRLKALALDRHPDAQNTAAHLGIANDFQCGIGG